MSRRICEYLGIPEEFIDEFESLDLDYLEDTGSSGEMTYSYYFVVPEDISNELLVKMGWEVGQPVGDIEPYILDEEEQ